MCESESPWGCVTAVMAENEDALLKGQVVSLDSSQPDESSALGHVPNSRLTWQLSCLSREARLLSRGSGGRSDLMVLIVRVDASVKPYGCIMTKRGRRGLLQEDCSE